MYAFLRSALMIAVGVVIAVSVSTLPTRAADNSKDRIDKLEKQVGKLQKKLKYMHVEKGEINGLAGPHVIFELCNVHIRSGSSSTSDGTVNLATLTEEPGFDPAGWGNLIVGYDEPPLGGGPVERGGSNNLVVGPCHNFPGVGSVVFGQQNTVEGPFGSITGGNSIEATVAWSSVSGGDNCTANGEYSSVSGGQENLVNAVAGSISGGFGNYANGEDSSISGGGYRSTSGVLDWVAGSLFEEN